MKPGDWCVNAKIGCTECKKRLAAGLLKRLTPFYKRRLELEHDKAKVAKILDQGREKAISVTSKVLSEVKKAAKI